MARPTRSRVASTVATSAAVLVVTIGALVAAGHGLAGSGDPVDEAVVGWVADVRTPWLDAAAAGIGQLVGVVGIPVLAVAVAAAAGWRWRRWDEPLLVAAVLGLESGLYLLVAHLVDRPRPPLPPVGWLPPTASFPSGHVAASVALTGVALVLLARAGAPVPVRRAAGAAAVLLVALAGAARVYAGLHWPSDALAGAALGGAALVAAVGVARALSPRPRAATTASPDRAVT